MDRPFNPLPTPRLNPRPSAQWERQSDRSNRLLWAAIGLAFAVGTFALNADLFIGG